MATIVTRSGKGSALTHNEVDANFNNLNNDKLETSAAYVHPTTAGNKHVPAGGSSGQILGYSSAGTAQWQAAPSSDLVDDTSPQLGGALDVNGHDIVSASNGAIELDPNGSGKVVFKGNSTKGAGQFVLNCENNSHGITIKGPPHSASASYTLTLPNDDGTSGQSLITDGNGVTSWSTISGGGGDVVSDTSPQLGGDLQSNGHDVLFGDNDKAKFGAGSDLQIYHDGSNSFISDQGTGNLLLRVGDLTVQKPDGSETMFEVVRDGAVKLWYDAGSYSNPKLQTTSTGIDVTGAITVNGAALAGGADLYSANESSPSAQPSATGTNAIAIGDSAVASGTNSFATGNRDGYTTDATHAASVAFAGGQARKEDTLAGPWSYASGWGSSSIGNNNRSSSYGSTGAYFSHGIGQKAKASGNQSLSIGNYPISSANMSLSFSNYSEAIHDYSSAFGNYAKTTATYSQAFASGRFAATGDAQGCKFILRSDTTDGTAEAMTTDNGSAGSSNQVVAASDTCITFSGTVVAMQNGAQSYGSWEVKGLLVNDGGTTTVPNSAITVISNTSNWGLALSADNTNNALKIQVTGEASHNIRWVSNIQTSEVTFA